MTGILGLHLGRSIMGQAVVPGITSIRVPDHGARS